MRFILFILLLISASAETMGWRIPLERITYGLRPAYDAPDHRLPRLKQAPTESPFFEEGDPLLDVSLPITELLILRDTVDSPDAGPFAPPIEGPKPAVSPHQPEWAVWNERTQMLVAEGSPFDLWLLNAALQLESIPCNIEITVSLEREDAENEHVILTGRSGEKFEGKSEHLTVEVAPHSSIDRRYFDIQFAIEYRQANGETITVNSATTMRGDKEPYIAGWQDARRGWKMKISAECVTFDGVPFQEIQWVESEGELRTVDHYQEERRKTALGYRKIGDLLLRTFDVPPDFFYRITGSHPDNPDPFAVDYLPDSLREVGGKGLIDMRDPLRANGVKFDHPESLAVQSPTGGFLMVLASPEELDLIEQICAGGSAPPLNVAMHVDWSLGSAMLVTRSGEKATIESKMRDESTKHFQIAPNIGANDMLVDVMYSLESKPHSFALFSAATLNSGLEIQAARFTQEGEEFPVKLRGVVDTPYH